MYKGSCDVKSGPVEGDVPITTMCVTYSLWCTPDTVHVTGTFLKHNTDQ